MTIEDVGLYLEKTNAGDMRIEVAVNLASRVAASISGLFVSVDFDKHELFGLPISKPDAVKYHEDRQRQSQIAEQALGKAVNEASVQMSWHFEHDSLHSSLLHQALRSDLMVVGSEDRDGMSGVVNARVADCLVLESGKPVLIVSPDVKRAQIGRRVLVAWQPKRESMRAVADALPILRTADHVEVLAIQPNGSRGDDHGAMLGSLGYYLDRHAIDYSPNVMAPGTGSVADLIALRVREGDADMVVMGAYGHPRMLQDQIGGTSTQMLRESPVPLLMSH